MDKSVREILDKLRGYGLELYVREGVVHGRMRSGRMPYEARAWVERLQAVNDAAAAALRAEGVREQELKEMKDVRFWGERYQRGEIALEGKVVYDPGRGTARLRYREVQEK